VQFLKFIPFGFKACREVSLNKLWVGIAVALRGPAFENGKPYPVKLT